MQIGSDMLKMIGEDVQDEAVVQLKLQEEVKTIWRKFMSEGLPEEGKVSILKKYPWVDNLCVEAPKVNLEIQPLLADIAKKRDQHFVDTQNSLGTAIVALTAAVSLVITEPEEGLDYTRFTGYLCDAAKILADTFHQEGR